MALNESQQNVDNLKSILTAIFSLDKHRIEQSVSSKCQKSKNIYIALVREYLLNP